MANRPKRSIAPRRMCATARRNLARSHGYSAVKKCVLLIAPPDHCFYQSAVLGFPAYILSLQLFIRGANNDKLFRRSCICAISISAANKRGRRRRDLHIMAIQENAKSRVAKTRTKHKQDSFNERGDKLRAIPVERPVTFSGRFPIWVLEYGRHIWRPQ